MQMIDPKPGQVWKKAERDGKEEEWRQVQEVTPNGVWYAEFNEEQCGYLSIKTWRAWARDAELMNPR